VRFFDIITVEPWVSATEENLFSDNKFFKRTTTSNVCRMESHLELLKYFSEFNLLLQDRSVFKVPVRKIVFTCTIAYRTLQLGAVTVSNTRYKYW
jgi:hypothetical protein